MNENVVSEHETNEIRIKVLNGNGDMRFDPSLKHFRAGDTVKWISENGATFTISFPDRSPFPAQQLRSKGESWLEAKIADDAKGLYRYNVATIVGKTIFVDPGCPEIVVAAQ